MTKFLTFFLTFLMVLAPAAAAAQLKDDVTHNTDSGAFRLSVPLLQGARSPFDGLLIDEESALQCIEDAAAVDRLTIELAARNRELELSAALRDQFIGEQRTRIEELSRRSWWDENGNIFMLGVGLVLGVAASALVVGLAN